ncbi:MAG: hypothetical protein R3F55_18330 [Alphaproteobacteria bacterium]
MPLHRSPAWLFAILGLAQPAQAERIPPFAAQFGIWAVRCDQCNDDEESICALSGRTGSGWLVLRPIGDETEPVPPLAMEYLPVRELRFETRGTLSVTVDDLALATLADPDIVYLAMSGGLYVEAPATAALLPTLRAGRTLGMTFRDEDGAQSAAFPLDGFDAALRAMMAQLPIPRPTAAERAAFGCEG